MKKNKKPKEKPEPLFGPDFFKKFKTKEALAYWLAMPKTHREPKMQKDLAKLLGVSEERLCQIKKKKEFRDLVNEYRKEYFKDFTSNVLEGCLKQAESGDPRAQKLFLQYVEDFKETTRQESESTERREFVLMIGPQKLEELQTIIAQEKQLQAKKKGYIDAEIIKEDNEEISKKPKS